MSNVTNNVTDTVQWLPARYPLVWAHGPDDVPDFDPLRQSFVKGESFTTHVSSSQVSGFSPYSVVREGSRVTFTEVKAAPKGVQPYPCLVRATPFNTREWVKNFYKEAPEENVYKVLKKLFLTLKNTYPDVQDKGLQKQIEAIAKDYGLLNPYLAQNGVWDWLRLSARCWAITRVKALLDSFGNDKVKDEEMRDGLCKNLGLMATDDWLTQNMNHWWGREAESVASQVLQLFLETKTIKKLRAKLRENFSDLFASGVKGRLDYIQQGGSYRFVARVGINTWLNLELAQLLYSTQRFKVCLYCGEELVLTPQTAKRNYCPKPKGCKQTAYCKRRYAKTL
jgi:hypothetical protein